MPTHAQRLMTLHPKKNHCSPNATLLPQSLFIILATKFVQGIKMANRNIFRVHYTSHTYSMSVKFKNKYFRTTQQNTCQMDCKLIFVYRWNIKQALESRIADKMRNFCETNPRRLEFPSASELISIWKCFLFKRRKGKKNFRTFRQYGRRQNISLKACKFNLSLK